MTELYDKYIDSRDLIKRLEELRDERAEIEEREDITEEERAKELKEWEEDNDAELAQLLEVESESPTDWLYGETFIREDAFEEYVQELVTDCGYISRDFPSWIEIDWERTADNVKADYSEYTLEGSTYYARNC